MSRRWSWFELISSVISCFPSFILFLFRKYLWCALSNLIHFFSPSSKPILFATFRSLCFCYFRCRTIYFLSMNILIFSLLEI
ncbi:hypothetical protein B0H66DRAFT_171319 [Apodospora peruviana]|uniref:Uncharacterized protein n=1 Tax=Apodospora peruviana TaxID=516989 RepID=A0AAE0IKM5_9PEZI|nr:hypothetical protein B0H66DRAFT_171319 [Apodospora peruviana]